MITRKAGTVSIATVVLMAMAIYGYAQAPLGVNYQGIARNMDGTPKSEQPISIRVSILDGGISGVVEYSEIHEVVTNQFGLFALVIGQGEKIGDIQNIEWSTGDKWLQVEMDAEGGNNFEIIGAQQILSVPYAMYASQSGTELQGGEGISVDDDIITNAAPDQPVTLLGAGNVTVSGNYPDFIITGTDNIDDADNNPANELQTLDQEGTNVTLSDNGGSISIEDADADPSNEIQDLSTVPSGT
ncbi:MAG: hypothetical protein HKN67_10735, partial [Saprospiraceae bacterium]|nr:hypothetical protein [Saprospiraceae bacterium]